LEKSKIPPGIYRYTSHEYFQRRGTTTLCFEVFSLAPAAKADRLTMVGRRTMEDEQLVHNLLEGDEVRETVQYCVAAAGPGQPPAPRDTVAVFERTDTRLYVQRPVFLPGGIRAPFGRELAIITYDSEAAGEAARKRIAQDWQLCDAQSRKVSGIAQGSHHERIAVGRIENPVVSKLRATWDPRGLASAQRAVGKQGHR
jgi:hypothetical protein